MSTPAKPTPAPVAPRAPQPPKNTNAQPQPTFLFDKENYMWMMIGLGLIFLSFFLMAGGKSENPNEFKYEEIYSFRRITLAPIILLLGFAVEAYAIMKKPKEKSTES